jgi:hypothetical protein
MPTSTPTAAPDEAPVQIPLLPSEDALIEHLYLVERGVRPLALAGTCSAEPLMMLTVATRLERLTVGGRGFAFVADRGDGHAD